MKSMLLVVAAVALWSACTAMKVRYACPAMDVCIPWGTCQEENRFRQSPTSTGIRYMCGLTVGSEDHVCCNTTKLLPEAFEPTFEHWYYAQTEDEDDAAFAVVPWPGFGTVPITLDTAVEPEPDGPDEEPNRLCPDMSFCVPAVLCPHTFITYSMVEMALFGLQNARYECGTIGETATFACCQSHVVVTALFEYVRKFEEEFKDNFIMASGENSFLQIISEDEESKKSSLLNLFRFRLSSYTHGASDEDEESVPVSDQSQEISESDEASDESVLAGDQPQVDSGDNQGSDESVPDQSQAGSETVKRKRRRRRDTGEIVVPHGSSPPPLGVRPKSGSPITKKCGTSSGMSLYARSSMYSGESTPGQFPWHVAVLSSKNEYLCGGALIGDRWVLTVAHCVDEAYGQNLKVRVGDHDLLHSTKLSYQAYDVQVWKVNIHPHYMKTNLRADVAVLELQASVLHLQNVNRVCLPGELTYATEHDCDVSAWTAVLPTEDGYKPTTDFSSILRHSKYQTMTKEDCQYRLRSFPALGSFFRLQEGILCAKSKDSKMCLGDGGSALVCKSPSGQYTIKGLVSWGVGCKPNLPTAFVDVDYFLPYITSVIGEKASARPVKHPYSAPHKPSETSTSQNFEYYWPPKHHTPPTRHNGHFETTYSDPLKPMHGFSSPSSGYHTQPNTFYHIPPKGYGMPHRDYNASPTGYGTVAIGHGAPPPGYDSPPSGYGVRPTGYDSSPSGYSAPPPGYDSPPSGYGAPPSGYDSPPSGHDVPPAEYDTPPSSYVTPSKGQATGYVAPTKGHDSTRTGYTAPHSDYGDSPKGYDTPQTGYDGYDYYEEYDSHSYGGTYSEYDSYNYDLYGDYGDQSHGHGGRHSPVVDYIKGKPK